MPQGPLRASAARRRRLPAAAVCLSLALAGTGQAADPARVRPLTVPVNLPAPALTRPADPEPGLGLLLQQLQSVLDTIFGGHPEPAPPADLAAAGSAAAGSAAVPAEIIAYAGPLAAGTVVINLDRFQVYRILGGGFAELYRERSEAAVLARVGMAR